MTFPVYVHVFGLTIHPHALFEVLAYAGGFQLYLFTRRRWPRAAVPVEHMMWILVGCVFGALLGSKLLAWLESAPLYLNADQLFPALLGGKTIVGGLLGGWAGVEIVKKRLGITHSTGDGYVFPLILGMCIGRIGCFLTGLADHTYGKPTALPWAVDFGDGPRHPTQLYEIAFLLILGAFLLARLRRPRANGELFRTFMLGYLAFRFVVEFFKPRYTIPYVGLSAIQLACAAGAAGAAVALSQLLRPRTLEHLRPSEVVA